MIVTVNFKVINPPCQGQSKATGNPWVSQTVIVGWPDTTPEGREFENIQSFTLFGRNATQFAELGITEGMSMQVDLRFKTRLIGNRVINDNILFLIDQPQ